MSDLIKIIATGKSKHMPKGEVYYEPEAMAELLVSSGAAQYEEKEKKEVEPEKKKEVKPTAKKVK
jgi:CRISPR/Cas system endoribonuclease Cas6 (RAMP superfamily)